MAEVMQKVSKTAARREMDKYADKVSTQDVKDILEDEAKIKALFKHVDRLSRFSEEIAWCFRMFRDFLTRRYKKVPWRTIAVLVGAVTYAVSPLDLVPDFLPVVGWSDDCLVLALALASVKADLHEYKSWCQTKRQRSVRKIRICTEVPSE